MTSSDRDSWQNRLREYGDLQTTRPSGKGSQSSRARHRGYTYRPDGAAIHPGGGSRMRRRARRFSGGMALIFAAYLAVSTLFAVETARQLHARSIAAMRLAVGAEAPVQTPPRYLVLMVLDGARPDYFDLTSLPHVDALRAAGTQFTNAVSGILEAETPSGHATIATGLRPDRNGILGFDWANDNDRYSLFDPSQMGALDQILQTAHAPTIGTLYKRRYPGARVVAISGHKYYAATPLGGPDADAIIYYQGSARGTYIPVAVPGHTPPASLLRDPSLIGRSTHLPDGGEDHLVTKMALAVTRRMHPRILLLNYPEFDWPVGHVDGGSLAPRHVITLMKRFDADLAAIEQTYRKAGILDRTLFVITADHGMMPIKRFVPSSLITNAVAAAGTTASDIAPSSADYIWLTDPAKAPVVAQNVLGAHDPGIQSAYYLMTVGGKPEYVSADTHSVSPAAETANQYLLSSLLNGHEPSVVVFGREGTSFTDPQTQWRADHGGNTWESQHVPLIFSGPGIHRGVITDAPAQLDDLAPTILTAMGLRPRKMEGQPLTDALIGTPASIQQRRKVELADLQGVVDTLSNQDRAQIGG